MKDRFESLESGEVVSVQHDTQVLSGHRTFRVGELNDAIKNYLEQAIANWSEEKNGWFNDRGIDCEALRFGSNGWQKGRIRLCLEFCPDEPNAQVQTATHVSISGATPPTASIPEIGTTVSSSFPQASAAGTTNTHLQEHLTTDANTTDVKLAEVSDDLHDRPTVTETTHETTPVSVNDRGANFNNVAIPVAAATLGTVAAAAAFSAHTNAVITSDNIAQPPLVDTVLELEEHPSDRNLPHHNFDEIAFDFDANNKDRAISSSNGMMELDLTDLGLDFSEQDLLTFEANGMSDPLAEFANLQDLDRPENSGMLIDEVWNEMNQGNWPGIN